MRSTINTAAFQRKVDDRAFDYLMKCGFWVQGKAVEKVPVDEGTLMGSIDVVPFTVLATRSTTVRVGSNLEYASPVEFGTYAQREPIAYDTHTPGMRPRPYLRPALDELIQSLRTRARRR